jgi:uncharacterized protein (TIGR03089 family)
MSSGLELGAVPFALLQPEQVREYGDRPFLTFYDDGRGERVELSYKTFDNWVQKVANLLVEELGVGRGDRVATVAGTHWQASVVHFACWLVGACAVPVDLDEPSEGKVRILQAAEAETAFVREEFISELRFRDIPGVAVIALVADLFGNPAGDIGNATNFSRVVPSMPDHYDGPTGALEDAALTILASGATAPAGVVLSQTDLLLRAAAVAGRWGASEVDRTMATLPAHDVDGVVMSHVIPFGVGAGTVLTRTFDADTLLKHVADERVTVLSLTSTQVERLLASPTPGGLDLSRLRTVVYEGGPPPDDIASHWLQRFGVALQHAGASGPDTAEVEGTPAPYGP